MSLLRLIKIAAILMLGAAFPNTSFITVASATDTVNPSLFEGKKYRLIGPWRGGRAVTVTGVKDDPRT